MLCVAKVVLFPASTFNSGNKLCLCINLAGFNLTPGAGRLANSQVGSSVSIHRTAPAHQMMIDSQRLPNV